VIGQQIGAYRIERKLGEGGMGVVYVGVDVRLGRRAAIKQLLPTMSGDRTIVERFFNEAKAAASINHPGIVEIYDVGWHSDGSAYFAMKLLAGESLATQLKRGPLGFAMAATVARQIASALGAAHERGIVHRDLKPDNVVLVPDDEVTAGARATLLDFGIAKLLGDGAVEPSSRTRTGSVMGTPYYMSPEQCRGAGEVDHRTDIYALGCMLFEMLTGRPPFVAAGAGEILGMHQFVDAAPVLAKRAELRPQSMAEVAAALQPYVVGGRSLEMPAAPAPGLAHAAAPTFPSTLSPNLGGLPTRTGAPVPRRAPVLAAGAVGVVIAAIVVVLAVTGGSDPADPADPADPTAVAVVSDAEPVDAAGAEPVDAAGAEPVDAAAGDPTLGRPTSSTSRARCS